MSRNRARTHAIRALMAETGWNYTRAARIYDEGRAKAKVDKVDGSPAQPDEVPR